MRVELIEDENPGRVGICVDGPSDVLAKVLLRSSRPDGRQNRLACRHIEVGDEAERTVTEVLELDTLCLAGT